MGRWTGRSLAVILPLALVALGLSGRLISLYVDYLWFESVGYTQVYAVSLWSSLGLFAAGASAFLAIYLPNALGALALSRRLLRRVPVRLGQPFGGRGAFGGPFSGLGGPGSRPLNGDAPRPFGELADTLGGPDAARWVVERLGGRFVLVSAAVLALLMGLGSSGLWQTVLRAVHGTPFGVADPVFGNDVAFYVFTVPLLRAAQGWALWTLLLSTLGVAAVYGLTLYGLDPGFDRLRFLLLNQARGARSHLLVLAALLLLLLAAGFWLGMFDVLVSSHARLVGANFTDVHARIPATQALVAATVLTALLTLVATVRRDFWLPIAGGVLVVAAMVVGRGLLPALVQRLQVEPAELIQEQPYIAQNIRFTRLAYGLENIEEQTLQADEAVRAEDIRANTETVVNIRLWDHRPLRDTYNQVQSIRPYYVFGDVDIDRYVIDGQYRQVMLSARELAPDRLGQQAQTWVNRRLQYTHGYGLAMSPVNEVTPEGLPQLFVRDLPPAGRLPITRPEVYYGEQPAGYVIVNTTTEEFDYPKGDQSAFSTYTGEGGLVIGPLWRRLALAWYFADFNLLISNYLKPDSRVLFRRNVKDRVQRIAPFLKLDQDPYLVVADGQMVWMLDGYTSTDRYPYSQRVVERVAVGGAPRDGPDSGSGPAAQPGDSSIFRRVAYNYIRNSAKIVVNAYDGSIRVYLSDPEDPIARAYARIFPDLFAPLSEMPASLRAHVRYPEDLFNVQSVILRNYHVTDSQVFYNGEDVWGTAFEASGERRRPVEPYFVVMRLPGQPDAEFVLVVPFTPAGRQNMVAWLAARMDGPNYGRLMLYKFPRDRLIYGPGQVDARIDQDTTISSQLTLWNQQGSRVIRGNLLVFPIGNSTLYVEPIYLEAESGRLPELKRVVVATGNRLVMEPTLEEALIRLFGTDLNLPGSPGRPGPAPGTSQGPTAPGPPAPGAPAPGTPAPPVSEEVAALARAARGAYERALESLRAGDFARFGEELRQLEQRLTELERAGAP